MLKGVKLHYKPQNSNYKKEIKVRHVLNLKRETQHSEVKPDFT